MCRIPPHREQAFRALQSIQKAFVFALNVNEDWDTAKI